MALSRPFHILHTILKRFLLCQRKGNHKVDRLKVMLPQSHSAHIPFFITVIATILFIKRKTQSLTFSRCGCDVLSAHFSLTINS